MPKKKYPQLTAEEYNTAYMKVYYFLNRDRLLEKAKRPVNCPSCNKKMPYSSLSYHLRKCHNHVKQPKIKNNLVKEDGTFKLTFD